MELDKRIMSGKKPLTCFDVEQAKEFIGKECYFSDQLCTFNKLLDAYSYVTADILVSKEKYLYVGELLTVSDSDGSCYEAGINGEAEWFQFCLPCEWVKTEPKKKYRPFTLDEFVNKYSLGDEIILKIKANNKIEHKLFIEYIEDEKNINARINICLGGFYYSFKELFDNSELYTSEGWKPFGVIDEDRE